MARLFYKEKFLHKKKETDQQKANTEKTEDKYIVCPDCQKGISRAAAVANYYVCPECGSYFRVRTKNRIRMVCDSNSFIPWFEDVVTENPLNFPEYEEKLKTVQEKTGLMEGVTVGQGEIFGERVCLGVCDSRFLMGSMGHAVGEKIASAVERATSQKLPVILFCCSGGARMQEGIISLMQMAKTSAALKRHADAGLLYVTVLTDPTTGGVTASFAMLGDIILAEPGALIGFAGPRVIEQTIGEKLPKGFQSAEFQLEHGFVDCVVERKELKDTLYQIIKSHRVSAENESFSCFTEEVPRFFPTEPDRERFYKTPTKSAWEKVKEARNITRPSTLTYIHLIFDDFIEFHGDRNCRDDKTIVGGIAWIYGQPVTVIGVQKGNDAKECVYRNYGMTSPEGYRKALRLMKQAEKFHRPVICFINTSGAYPGMEAEELEATIERYNTMVEAGKDTDYDKAAASLKFTVGEGDLYAFDCRAVYLGTIGGVKVDEHLQVIDGDYDPIPGLYAAGTGAGGYYNGLGYPPYEGLACGFAWTSGRIAGESAAAYVGK